MEFIKVLSCFFVLLLLCANAFTQDAQIQQEEEEEGLPLLRTKQEIDNIRFISDDGRYTYYQRRSGSLLLSTNYSVDEIITNDPDTQYRVIAPPGTQNVLIEARTEYHSNLNLRYHSSIYKTTRGSQTTEKIAEGVRARLHLDGEWISYYATDERKIYFRNFSTPALRFNIEIQNTVNPYFVPVVEMVNESTVLYTDMSSAGKQAVLKLDRSDNEIKILLQAASANQQIDLCLLKQHLIIQEIGVMHSRDGSMIHKIPFNQLNIDNSETIYQSQHNDLGSLICRPSDNTVYFIKNTQEQTARRTSEVSKLSLDTGEYEIKTELSFVTQLIMMDQSLLIPLRDETYVLKGQSDFTSFDLLQQSIIED